MAEYTVYLAKTDMPIAGGSAKACAAGMGLASVGSFYSTLSRVRRGKNKKYIVVVDEGEEDEEDG